MAIPTWVNGQVLTASDVNNWLAPEAAYKTSSLGRSSTTLTADPDLTVSVNANSVYEIRCALLYSGSSSGVSAAWTWTVPAGASGGYVAQQPSSGFGYTWGTTVNSTITTSGVNYGNLILGVLIVSSTSGTINLKWAPATGFTMTMGVGTYLVARQIG